MSMEPCCRDREGWASMPRRRKIPPVLPHPPLPSLPLLPFLLTRRLWVAGVAAEYFVSLPANKLELWMALESGRFMAPVFRQLYSEKEVRGAECGALPTAAECRV